MKLISGEIYEISPKLKRFLRDKRDLPDMKEISASKMRSRQKLGEICNVVSEIGTSWMKNISVR